MSRTSLHRPRRPRAVWDRPATGTRLLPKSRRSASCGPPPTVSPGNPLSGDGRSIHLTRHPSSRDASCPTRTPHPGAPLSSSQTTLTEPGVKRLPGAILPPLGSTVDALGEVCAPIGGIEPRSHFSAWPSTSGGRNCPTPRIPLVPYTSFQKLGAVLSQSTAGGPGTVATASLPGTHGPSIASPSLLSPVGANPYSCPGAGPLTLSKMEHPPLEDPPQAGGSRRVEWGQPRTANPSRPPTHLPPPPERSRPLAQASNP